MISAGLSGEHAERPLVVVGGANIDIKAHIDGQGGQLTSNPGRTVLSLGGVGRNIAENLTRLGRKVRLIAPVGSDQFGEQLIAGCRAAGMTMDYLIRSAEPTGTYTAVLDADGELVTAVAAMQATEMLTVEQVEPVYDLLINAAMLIIDGNIPADVIAWLLSVAHDANVPVSIEPVSCAKGARLMQVLAPSLPVFAITPNVAELAAMVPGEPSSTTATKVLHDNGVDHVWVRNGAQGSVLSQRPGGTAFSDREPVIHREPAPPAEVVDVTGAGDAMTAAFVHAILLGQSVASAAHYGHLAAAATIASPHTVRPDLSDVLGEALPIDDEEFDEHHASNP